MAIIFSSCCCKDFDLSSYNLYQLEAELVPQPEFRDYLKENFIRKKDAKPFNYNIYHGIMVEKEKNQGENIERESLQWNFFFCSAIYLPHVTLCSIV